MWCGLCQKCLMNGGAVTVKRAGAEDAESCCTEGHDSSPPLVEVISPELEVEPEEPSIQHSMNPYRRNITATHGVGAVAAVSTASDHKHDKVMYDRDKGNSYGSESSLNNSSLPSTNRSWRNQKTLSNDLVHTLLRNKRNSMTHDLIMQSPLEPSERVMPQDDGLKLKYIQAAMKRRMRSGTRTLLTIWMIMVFFRTNGLIYREAYSRHLDCNMWPLAMSDVQRWFLTVFEILLWILVTVLLILCRRSCTQAAGPFVYLYHATVYTFATYIVFLWVPPFNLHCDNLIERIRCLNNAYERFGIETLSCGLTSTNVMMATMLAIFCTPYIIPLMHHMVPVNIFILLLFIAGSLWHNLYFDQDWHTWSDSVLGFSLLLIVVLFAVFYKRKLEIKERDVFRIGTLQRDQTRAMFHILESMLPMHLVLPLLKTPDEVIADEFEVASILFITIADFNTYAAKSTPEDLLDYLNSIFMDMDTICESCSVTKIETVSEEYVAAVGVVPEDLLSPHEEILGGLIKAAIGIKNMKMHNVQFKMGIHTGPVVAGVVGHKLPRFRLFGDTVNTSARLMQKGIVNELQFGQATKEKLPSWVRMSYRGPIELKGKGIMEAYLLDWESDPVDGALNSATSDILGGASAVSLEEEKKTSRVMEGVVEDFVMTMKSTFTVGTGGRQKLTSSHELGEPIQSMNTQGFSKRPSLKRSMTDNTRFATALEVMGRNSREDHMEMDLQETNTSNTQASLDFEENAAARGSELTSTNHLTFMGSASRASRFRLSASPRNGARRLFGLNSQGLSDEEYEEWRVQYYTNRMYHKVAARNLRDLLVMIIFSVVEVLLVTITGHFENDKHSFWAGASRMTVFIVARIVAVVLYSSWLIAGYFDLIKRIGNPDIAMLLRLISMCLVSISLFVSYDALTPQLPELGNTADRAWIKKVIKDQPYRIRLMPMIFIMRYTIMLFNLSLPLLHTAFFLAVSTAMVFLTSSLNGSLLQIPDWNLTLQFTQALFFFCFGVVGFELARSGLVRSKEQFKMKKAMIKMSSRSENVLNSLMPPMVVDQIRANIGITPSHKYTNATIVQSDIVGFTRLSSTKAPKEVVDFVSGLFKLFDDLTDEYSVYKVETVGDAYIAAQADEPLTSRNRPWDVIMFGSLMINATQKWAQEKQEEVDCRCGIHTGECIGGIVGTQMQRYHLFGSLLGEVEALESTAPEGRVHVSAACKAALAEQLNREGNGWKQLPLDVRTEDRLTTSKGEVVEYAAAGGHPTYLLAEGVELSGFLRAAIPRKSFTMLSKKASADQIRGMTPGPFIFPE